MSVPVLFSGLQLRAGATRGAKDETGTFSGLRLPNESRFAARKPASVKS